VFVLLKGVPGPVPVLAWSRVRQWACEIPIEETAMPGVVTAWMPKSLDEHPACGREIICCATLNQTDFDTIAVFVCVDTPRQDLVKYEIRSEPLESA
jgi:hypothetical protein